MHGRTEKIALRKKKSVERRSVSCYRWQTPAVWITSRICSRRPLPNGLETELGYSRYDYKNKDTDNSRNGHSSKRLHTSFGEVDMSVPQDRK